MNTITDGCCIIDALCGIDTASPQVGQFSDNFTKIKFVIKKDLRDYNILLLTDTNGEVNFIAPDDSVLIKDTDSDTGETTLLWNIGREITSKSTVVIYQIVAYKGEIDNPESTWYSKEGRLTVTQSIDSSSKSASVIGTYPNLLTRLILNIEKCRENNDILSDKKVDKEDGYGLSENNFSHKLKEKLENIEDGANVNVNPDWAETDENKDSYIKNKPLLSKVATSGSYDDLSDKPDIPNDDDVKRVMRTYYHPVMRAESDDEGNKIRLTYARKDELASVATSGSYNDLSDKPEIPEMVDDIDSISGDEEKEVVPSARAVKIHASYVLNDAVNYVDRNVINKIVNDLTAYVAEDAIPTARCTQKYIQDTASEVVAYVDGAIGDIETSLENIIAKYGLGGDGV